ncbi:MAG: hypothetical protein WCH57_05645 [Verrucomicrobiota bacterium]
MSDRAEQKIRTTPRVSINKLAEYLGSSKPLRRRTILMEQKFPQEFVTARYKEAFDAIVDFFVDPNHDEDRIHRVIERIQARPAHNENQITTKKVNVQALKHFLKALPKLPLGSYTFRRASEKTALLNVAGVDISVRPELELVVNERGGGVSYGLLKLYVGKTYPLDDDIAAYVGTTVHQYGESHFPAPSNVSYKHCYVLDVFRERIYSAPKSFVKRRRDIEAACAEIEAQWANLQ